MVVVVVDDEVVDDVAATVEGGTVVSASPELHEAMKRNATALRARTRGLCLIRIIAIRP